MRFFGRFLPIVSLLGGMIISACTMAQPEQYLSHNNNSIDDIPKITQLLLKKGDRKLYLFHKQEVVRVYDIDLGFNPKVTKANRVTDAPRKDSTPSIGAIRKVSITARSESPTPTHRTAPVPWRAASAPVAISSFTAKPVNPSGPEPTGRQAAPPCRMTRWPRSMH